MIYPSKLEHSYFLFSKKSEQLNYSIINIFLIAMAAVACKPSQTTNITTPADPATALNDIWALEEIDGVAVAVNDFGREIPVLEFHKVDGQVMGNSGCNRLSGSYKIEGAKISFGPMISTKMACPGNGEQRFLNALNTVDAFRIENLKLYLLKGDSEVLQFRKVD